MCGVVRLQTRRASDYVCEGSGCTEIKPFPVSVPSSSHHSVHILYRKLSGATCHRVQLDVCWEGKGGARWSCTVSWADAVLQVHSILAVSRHLLQLCRELEASVLIPWPHHRAPPSGSLCTSGPAPSGHHTVYEQRCTSKSFI